jgi:hypothetical protein
MGSASIVVAGAALLLLAPKSAHAVVAALVQVANTSATPVPVSSVNDPGRIPYQATMITTLGQCQNVTSCGFIFNAVPANHRLAIQQVSGSFSYSGAASVGASVIVLDSLSSSVDQWFPVSGSPLLFMQPMTTYFEAGRQPQVIANLPINHFLTGMVTVTGYMLDCSVATCSPIVTQ